MGHSFKYPVQADLGGFVLFCFVLFFVFGQTTSKTGYRDITLKKATQHKIISSFRSCLLEHD